MALLSQAGQLTSWPGQPASKGAALPFHGNWWVGVPAHALLSCPVLYHVARMLKPAVLSSPSPGPHQITKLPPPISLALTLVGYISTQAQESKKGVFTGKNLHILWFTILYPLGKTWDFFCRC